MTKAALILSAFLVTCATFASALQRGGPPRRLVDPQTAHLPGGSRVEFRSFFSPSLGQEAHYSIYLPPAYEREPTRKFPVVYFLHGLFNDYTSWAVERYGNFPGLIEDLLLKEAFPQFVMIHPDGNNSFYTDFADGTKKYEQYIYQDLIEEAEKHVRVRSERSARAIGGTSMGGYGALKIAMRKPDIFNSVAAGSPIIWLGDNPWAQVSNPSSRTAAFLGPALKQIFGDPFDPDHWKRNSIEFLARTGDLKRLNIYLAYGTADRYQDVFPMEEGIQAIHHILTQRNISHVFKAYEAEPHGWELIRNHVEEILRFLTQTF